MDEDEIEEDIDELEGLDDCAAGGIPEGEEDSDPESGSADGEGDTVDIDEDEPEGDSSQGGRLDDVSTTMARGGARAGSAVPHIEAVLLGLSVVDDASPDEEDLDVDLAMVADDDDDRDDNDHGNDRDGDGDVMQSRDRRGYGLLQPPSVLSGADASHLDNDDGLSSSTHQTRHDRGVGHDVVVDRDDSFAVVGRSVHGDMASRSGMEGDRLAAGMRSRFSRGGRYDSSGSSPELPPVRSPESESDSGGLPPLPPLPPVDEEETSPERLAALFPELQPHSGSTKWPSPPPPVVDELVVHVRTVRQCIELPHTPLMENGLTAPQKEPLLKVKSRKVQRRRFILEEMSALQDPASVLCRPLYDVDNADVAGQAVFDSGVLKFESRFESGNLRTATMMHPRLYDLVLSPDINTMGHTQWFFFSVSNMKPGVAYRFNIINLEKANSQYNFGMQPVMYSEQEAEQQGLGWHRVGTKVGYHKNNLKRNHHKKTSLFSASFTVTFKYANDTCYLAYHYPFTYSDCQTHLARLTRRFPRRIRCDLLCTTLGGNRCDLLTITSSAEDDELQIPIATRKYVVLSARVHPGESNSSWMMKGALDFLTSDHPEAVELRRQFVFKIVPMLNPDGVANGNHRCSLAGADLNRKWRTLHPQLHPTIASTKLLFKHLRSRGTPPVLYCDFHGHSRRKMVFIYGCSNDMQVTLFPRRLAAMAPQFSYKSSRFSVTDDKEGSARVAVWREFGVVRSYTMESTFAGFDKGDYRGDQINIEHLEGMGRAFVMALSPLARSPTPASGSGSGTVSPAVRPATSPDRRRSSSDSSMGTGAVSVPKRIMSL
eukprot:m.45545 g.45545  ORF g.45545 m.45545 type:complete len:827 (+) comp6663_c0_seq1:303-2783(+)